MLDGWTKTWVHMCIHSGCNYNKGEIISHTGESHQHLGVQELLHRAGASARRRGSSERDGQDGEVSGIGKLLT